VQRPRSRPDLAPQTVILTSVLCDEGPAFLAAQLAFVTNKSSGVHSIALCAAERVKLLQLLSSRAERNDRKVASRSRGTLRSRRWPCATHNAVTALQAGVIPKSPRSLQRGEGSAAELIRPRRCPIQIEPRAINVWS